MGNLGSHFRLLETIPRNLKVRGASGEVSDRNEKHVVGNSKKGGLCCEVSKSLAESCSTVPWKIECLSHEPISPYCL